MKNTILTLVLLFMGLITVAQQRFSGKVVSAVDTRPLSDVSITLKRAKINLNTNQEGRFSFFLNLDRDTLVFSHLGYFPKKIVVHQNDAKNMFIQLDKQEQLLEEVNIVSSGYQKLPKERATGSFNFIGQKTFNEQVGTTVLSRLEAVSNGLFADRSTITGGGKLIVRGLSTIRGPREALIILDNFPYEGSLDNLNPNDVENITILKDAAATSIWGARAGNGVIVITTRRGEFNRPISIDFNVNTTVIEKPDLYYLKQMSSADYISAEEFLFSKGKYNSDLNSTRMVGQTPIVELLAKKAKGLITQADYDAAKVDLSRIDVRDQYNKYLYSRGFNQQYALNLKGGSANQFWSLSSGYDHNSSVLSEKYSRYNLRLQHTYRPVKNLELSAGIFYTQSKNTSGKPAYGQILNKTSLYPYARFADNQGNPLAIMKDYRTGYVDTVGKGKLLDWKYYPLEDYKHAVVTQSVNDIVVNGGLNYKLFKGFSAELKYQYQRQQTGIRDLKDDQSYYARNMVNTFTQLPAGQPAIYEIPRGGILDLINTAMQSSNVRGQLNYANQWGKNEVNIITGAERRDAKTISDQSRVYGYDDQILSFGNVDYLTLFPNYTTKVLNYIMDNRQLGQSVNRFVSTYANSSYTYNGKYTVSASARRDASNLFGLNTNDQWTPLWSAGTSWDITKEHFYHFTALPYLRLRATYGFSGNIDPSMTAVTTIGYVGIGPDIPSPQAQFLNYFNPDLTWERSRMINYGLDFRMKDNRLSGSIEYFSKRGTNLYGGALIDYTGGVGTSIVKNVASTKGQGLDIELNSLNISAGQFSWTTNLNVSFYKDRVVTYYLYSQQGSNYVNQTATISGVVGKPTFSIFSYHWAGLDPVNGNPQGYLNGQISTDYGKLTGSATTVKDLQFNGSALPTSYGSVGNTFNYKGFSLTARVIYKMGYYFRRNTIRYNTFFGNGTGHSDYALRWQYPGDEKYTDVPSLIYPGNTSRDSFYAGSDALVEKGDHVRLQYINFAYQMTHENFQFLPFKTMSVYVNAANLGLLWTANKKHLDPDFQGNNVLKPARTFSLGIRANLN